MRSSSWCTLTLVGLLAGCQPPDRLPVVFEDHTLPKLQSIAEFEALSAEDHGREVTKFVITGFGTDDEAVSYYDSRFYALHDEWYWFRLLNGQTVPGHGNFGPVSELEFDSIANIYAWARTQQSLPLDLTWVSDDRLYSPLFYDLSLFRPPRAMGVGTVMRVHASGLRAETWGLLLEFSDKPTHGELVRFFRALERTMPSEISAGLKWVVRSPGQETLAQQMEQQQLELHDRIVRLKDLTVEGETEVYSAGLTAGRLRIIRSGQSLDLAQATDILVLEDVPDFLPPAAGVVTAVPQTPLAHFNLLARNRGIPNAYRGGVLEDATIDDLDYVHSPVVIQAKAPDQLLLKQITETQLRTWQQLQSKPPVSVTPVDVASLPLTYDLTVLPLSEVDVVRRSAGGKAAGYMALIAGAPGSTPDGVIAISIRPYVEHLAPLLPLVSEMLKVPAFIAQPRARYLALEGAARYAEVYRTADDQQFAADFMASQPVGNVLGDFARAGGLKDVIRAQPIASATAAALQQAMVDRFGHYAVSQGLRFRSSSTAEDVEGFNGAGLYDSNTGFLDAAAQRNSDDREKTVEWAVKKTWASYWSFEAFEERRLENVDHLSGNMGVVAHARFDDDLEQSNGVFLFTLQRDRSTMELNVQAGALSVTNPTSTALPEIDRVTMDPGATVPRIERLRSSTVVPAGTLLLTDAQLLETFARAKAVAQKWLEQDNVGRPPAQQGGTVVLDFEFRQMPQGWPALKTGTPFPARIVLKQTRSLEPSARQLALEVREMPIPKDVLARARRVERRVCESEAFVATLVEVFTDPLLTPDLGFSTEPFTAQVVFGFKQAMPDLGQAAGSRAELVHLDLSGVTHPGLSATAWGLHATSSKTPTEVTFGADGSWKLQSVSGSGLSCRVMPLHSTPTEYLLGLLGQ